MLKLLRRFVLMAAALALVACDAKTQAPPPGGPPPPPPTSAPLPATPTATAAATHRGDPVRPAEARRLYYAGRLLLRVLRLAVMA